MRETTHVASITHFSIDKQDSQRYNTHVAAVAELADAHGSGPCVRKDVGVQVPSAAVLANRHMCKSTREPLKWAPLLILLGLTELD